MNEAMIEFEGQPYRLMSIGARRNGKTYCHLSSTPPSL